MPRHRPGAGRPAGTRRRRRHPRGSDRGGGGAYVLPPDVVGVGAVVMGDAGPPPLAASAAASAGEAEALGLQVARELLARGAGRYLTAAAAHTSNGDDAQ